MCTSAITGVRTFRNSEDPNAVVLVMNVTDMDKLGEIVVDPNVQILKEKHTVLDPISVHVEVDA